MAEVHLDQGRNLAFSEGDAAMVLDDQVPNEEESGVSAAEALVVDVVLGNQEIPGNVSADECSQTIAGTSVFLRKEDTSEVADSTVELPDVGGQGKGLEQQ